MKKAGLILILLLFLGVTVGLVVRRPAEKRAAPTVVTSRATAKAAEIAHPESGQQSAPATENKTPPDSTPKGPVLSDAVTIILSPESPYILRAQQIKTLGRNLSADDVTALRDFLLLPPAEVQNLKPRALNSIKNDLLEVLMDQKEIPEGLGQQVVDMFNDPTADYMWREYCLQFMQPFYERVAAESRAHEAESTSMPNSPMPSVSETPRDFGAPSPLLAEQALVREALFSALNARDQDLAGTALLGLNRLAKRNGESDQADVLAKAVEIAADPAASARCRLTALRVAAANGSADILPTARELAVNGSTDLLRGAAITTLGDFGSPQDREFLSSIAANGNRQLKAAAQSALAKMEKK